MYRVFAIVCRSPLYYQPFVSLADPWLITIQEFMLVKKFASGALIAVIILLALFFGIVPPLVDHIINRKSPVPPLPVNEPAEQLHQSLFISDLHSDALLWGRDLSKGYNRGHTDIPRLIKGGMALQGFSVVTKTPIGLNIQRNDDKSDMIFWLGMAQAWPPEVLGSLLKRAERMAESLQKLADNQTDFFLIKNQKDLRQYAETRVIDSAILAGWLTLEGAQALEGKLENLDRLYDAGFRMVAPTHFFDTEIAGSAHGVNKGGLTELGRQWVHAMEAKSMIIDLAHASNKTIDEVLAMASRPVIVSHTGVKGICNNNRNLSDRQLEAIASKGGLIGIGFWSTAVCGGTVDAIARSIQYTVNLIGADHVALGSDFDGAVATPIDGTEMDQLTQALLNMGMTDVTIAKVMGGNTRDFLLANLPRQ